ncbi:hypothetical protein HT102_08390 [Hoyosella sp. G463]|uniref:Secreted protein n=1 Tax=Lolliginicoccus lacisalsi TaxID=2742202 RepID=A0A927JC17_9ACTN|nr:hypothetical protein [Lolliginicoccus lacisalsi]MBD8506501.1 hypothetical protein [Lolliginicoccus lacisalsi]
MKRTAAVLGAGALAFAASWGPALASHNGAVVTTAPAGECGETTFEATINDAAGTHKSNNMMLVVSAEGNTQTAPIPVDGSAASITVGPFTSDTTTISYRVFGGGERDYDDPAWTGYGTANFGADIGAYGDENGYDWVVSGPDDPNPFTTFNTLDVEGCPGGGIEVCLGGGVDVFDFDAVLGCLEAQLMTDFGGLS